MERNQKIILGVLLAVVVLGGAAYILFSKKQAGPNQTNQTTKKAPVFKKTDAPAGQLAVGFPKELILDPNAATKQSYSIKYDSANQFTANFNSSLSTGEIYKLYITYLTANGYSIKNQSNTATFSSIYATKNSTIVNAVFTRTNKTAPTTATITYVK
jgi:flagellar basal body-associated protein FliL